MEINTLSRELLRAMGIGATLSFHFPNNAKLLAAKANISILAERDGMKFTTKKIDTTTLEVTRTV